MTTGPYQVASVDLGVDDDHPASCGSCDWTGPASDTLDIDDCSLTPGDASPVGRCPDPECNSLCYLDLPDARDLAKAFLDLWPVLPGQDRPKVTPDVLVVWNMAKKVMR